MLNAIFIISASPEEYMTLISDSISSSVPRRLMNVSVFLWFANGFFYILIISGLKSTSTPISLPTLLFCFSSLVDRPFMNLSNTEPYWLCTYWIHSCMRSIYDADFGNGKCCSITPPSIRYTTLVVYSSITCVGIFLVFWRLSLLVWQIRSSCVK